MATLAEYRTRLAAYKAAEIAVLKGQSYTIKDRTLTRASLKHIQDMIRKLEEAVKALQRGGSIRVKRGVPREL
jgi:tRNA(Leu) C34 or U34 (ribose-2'-O)-methylase TrmL